MRRDPMRTPIVVVIALGFAGVVTLANFVPTTSAASKRVAQRKFDVARQASVFQASEGLLDQGKTKDALVSLRSVQASTKALDSGEATRRIAVVLQQEGRPREALDEYARLITMVRSSETYSNSRVEDGLIHARMASIALDLGDEALLTRVLRDLAFQRAQTSIRVEREIKRRRNEKGDLNADRFEAQTRDIKEVAKTSALTSMARQMDRDHDLAHRNRLYELAIKQDPDARLMHEYGRRLDSSHQPRAAFRILSQVQRPYPEDIRLSIEEALRTLSYKVTHLPKISESQEENEAIRRLARLRDGATSPTQAIVSKAAG